MLKDRSLRFQLTVAISGVMAASTLFVALGTYIYVTWGEYQFYGALSPEARAAYSLEWAETGMPAEHLVREIAIAEEQILAPVYERELSLVMLLSAIAIMVSGSVGLMLAKRLTAPLELATESARTIAAGDFGHRIRIPASSPREVASLVESFTHLAESLERMERDVQYTSASIAHEIRTPLTVIQGYLQGMRDGVFEASDEQLDLMLHRMTALGRLIDDLKTLSLADSGRLRIEPAVTELGRRIHDMVEWLRRDGRRRVVFEAVATFESEPKVSVDGGRIEQVVLALIDNALTYGGDGRVTVRYTRTGDGVVISVSDEGMGFSAEALARAGERFWRDESSRSRETGGSGLGLAVAKAVVEAHGGRLVLRNREVGGATVEAHLPTVSRPSGSAADGIDRSSIEEKTT